MAVSAVVLLLSEEYARIQARYRSQPQRDRAWTNATANYPHQQVSAAVKVYQRGIHITEQFELARGLGENPTLHQFAPSGTKQTDPVAVNIRVVLRREDGAMRTDNSVVGVTWAAGPDTLLAEAEAFVAWLNERGSQWKLESWEVIGPTRYPPH